MNEVSKEYVEELKNLHIIIEEPEWRAEKIKILCSE
jgi:hypothetical protein